MMNTPNGLEQLIHEALTQLGWEADAKRVAERVRRLNQGLPREDEFSVLCGWLGRCELIHKLDQKQTPQTSTQAYQVPDLLAIFRVGDRQIPVLVEVKSKTGNVLSFRPDYFQRLTAYASAVKLPLLVAWKHYDVWTLFDIRHLQKRRTNFNTAFSTAMIENLLGILAGDFSYSLQAGAGVHLRFRKEDLLHTTTTEGQTTQEWSVVCDDVHFTNGRGRRLRSLSPSVQSLFLAWDLEERERHTETHIVRDYLADGDALLFAHMALVRLLDFYTPMGGTINWRLLLSRSRILHGVEEFKSALNEAIKLSIVRLALNQRPRTLPNFLQGDSLARPAKGLLGAEL